MIWEKTFNPGIDQATARQRALTFFRLAGYKLEREEAQTLRFQRGSSRGSWFPLNPSEVKTLALVRFSGDSAAKIKVEFDVGLKFKDETHFTEEYWAGELSDFGRALSEDKYRTLRSQWLTARAAWALVKSLRTSVTFILLWAVVSFALTWLILWAIGYNTVQAKIEPALVALLVMAGVAVGTMFVYRRWSKRSISRK
jgi:hypothetical protein